MENLEKIKKNLEKNQKIWRKKLKIGTKTGQNWDGAQWLKIKKSGKKGRK